MFLVLFFVCESVWASVCLSVSQQKYGKSNPPISKKLGVVIGPTEWKNRLTFGGDPISDTSITDHFSTSLAVAEYGILGDLLAFLIELPADFHETRQNDCSRHFGSNSADNQIWSGFKMHTSSVELFS